MSDNPEVIPNNSDKPQRLLFKLAKILCGIDFEEIIATLRNIDNNTQNIEITAESVNLNVDELEDGIGLRDGTYGAKQLDPDTDASLISYTRGLLEVVTEMSTTGLRTLKGATTRPTDTATITNSYGSSFLLTKVIVREVSTIDANVAFSLGVTGTPQLYAGIINLTPADFSGGNTYSVITFGSGIPVASASDFLVTAGGPATVGELEYTLIGVLI